MKRDVCVCLWLQFDMEGREHEVSLLCLSLISLPFRCLLSGGRKERPRRGEQRTFRLLCSMKSPLSSLPLMRSKEGRWEGDSATQEAMS